MTQLLLGARVLTGAASGDQVLRAWADDMLRRQSLFAPVCHHLENTREKINTVVHAI